MATLEKIRSKGPLVATVIGLALLAFILGDFIRSGDSLFSRNKFQIAQVAGESLQYQEFEKRVEDYVNVYKIRSGQSAIDENTMEQIRQQVWDQMVQESVMRNEYSHLGVGVSSDELYDMVTGKNVDPMIRQSFTNPETGQFNPSAVVQFLKNMDQDPSGNSKLLWLFIENELSHKRAFTKYTNLIAKGLYVTKSQTESEFSERSYIIDFKYVAQKYATISDSSVAVSEADLKSYYEQHKKEYKQGESRGVEYVTFDVVPSNDDRAAAQDWINKIKPELATATDVKQFVNSNSDVPFNEKHFKKGELPNKELDSMMFKEVAGFVYGPYLEDNTFKLAKLVEVKDMSDSVKARHILIQPDGKKIVDMKRAKVIADSLKDVIVNKKGDFTKLAETFSADQGTAKKGGQLDKFAEGAMVKPFNDACFNGKKGDLVVVESQFGIHIIEVQEKTKEIKKVQVAIVQRKIEPSSRTYQAVYADASKFRANNDSRVKFEKSIVDLKLTKKVAPNLAPTEKVIAGLDNPREMVRWAYKSEKNDVSQVFEFGQRYVVAVLTDIREKGYATLEQVKPQLEYLVRQDKKAEILIGKMKSATSETSIEAVGQKLSSNVSEAKNISFSSFQVPDAGYEPELIASAVLAAKDKISAPIKGKNGVYIFVVTSITPAPDAKGMNLSADKTKLSQGVQSRANYQAYEALKELADITDNRAKFY